MFFKMRSFAGIRVCAGMVLAAGLISGCGKHRDLPLNEEVARQSLVTSLDAWKQGGKPQSLKGSTPPIIVGDSTWESGHKLVSYQVLEPATSDGANLHVAVQLVLREAAGNITRRRVVYVVGTSPAITVFPE